ncbi:MAG: hypothetical protein HQ593_02000 [Candidatus Omnitrophica bacterium]|nr:hypothetical protein [Candidatus Omnitrophota bacterium]
MKQRVYSSKKITILDYFRMISRYRQPIFGLAVFIAILTYAIAAAKPDIYKASVRAIKPNRGGYTSNSLLGISLLDAARGDEKGEIIEYLMSSRRMAEDVAKEFNLAKEWGVSTEVAAAKVQKMVDTHTRPQMPIMDIWAFGKDPDLLVDIIKFMLTNLDKLNNDLDITTDKPLLIVLDEVRADREPVSKNAGRKAVVAFLLVSVTMITSIFFWEYIQKLKAEEKRAAI